MKYTRKNQKYNSNICNNDMTFQDCELAILQHAIEEGEVNIKKKNIVSNDTDEIILILETFLIRKKLICYGGTAINNILPKKAQYYDRSIEIPDYDFYSTDAMNDAIELTDIYYKKGYTEVEAKAGLHVGTFKVFVNFIPIADITCLPDKLFQSIGSETITIDKIRYAPPNFLRMNMYLELSRPAGDISRWDKVFRRLTLLNKYYPFSSKYNCEKVKFQRKIETVELLETQDQIYETLLNTFIQEDVVFFGGYANSLYSQYMPLKQQQFANKIPDFDVLSENPDRVSNIVVQRLQKAGFKTARRIKHQGLGEIIPLYYEIYIGKELLAFIYQTIACHSYNILPQINGKEIRVATIDTMMTFYLAFYYSDTLYYNNDRILCMAEFLYKVQKKNRLNQDGLLKRFSIQCYGEQEQLYQIRAKKTEKFKELSKDPTSIEYKQWFLKYSPLEKEKGGHKGRHIKKHQRYNKKTVKYEKKIKTKKNNFELADIL